MLSVIWHLVFDRESAGPRGLATHSHAHSRQTTVGDDVGRRGGLGWNYDAMKNLDKDCKEKYLKYKTKYKSHCKSKQNKQIITITIQLNKTITTAITITRAKMQVCLQAVDKLR